MADICSYMLARISAIEASVGGPEGGVVLASAPVMFTRTPVVATWEVVGGIGGAWALVVLAMAASMIGKVSDTKLVRRRSLLLRAYGGE